MHDHIEHAFVDHIYYIYLSILISSSKLNISLVAWSYTGCPTSTVGPLEALCWSNSPKVLVHVKTFWMADLLLSLDLSNSSGSKDGTRRRMWWWKMTKMRTLFFPFSLSKTLESDLGFHWPKRRKIFSYLTCLGWLPTPRSHAP